MADNVDVLETANGEEIAMLDAAYELGPAAEDYPVRIRVRCRTSLVTG